MKVKDISLTYVGWHPVWVTPALLVNANKYDTDFPNDYEYFITIEINWLAWNFYLWIEF